MSASFIHPRSLEGYGLIEAAFEPTTERFGSYVRADQAGASVKSVTSDTVAAIAHLSRLSFPATRLVLVDLGEWTGVLTNSRNGSDFAGHQFWATKTMRVRTIRVVDSDPRWSVGADGRRERMSYEARIVELHGPAGELIRSITCVDDGGRWVFETAGTLQPFEESFDYGARRKRDRFTRDNLRGLLTVLGPGPVTSTVFVDSPRYALVNEPFSEAFASRIAQHESSHEEADDPALGYYRRGMGFVPFMATHAASVVADFERAIAINPTFEPRVREPLREARRAAAGRAESR